MTQGESFGRYRIIRLLGRGMSDVYLAQDDQRSQPVVLKVIGNDGTPHARAVIEAETRGAQLQQQLHRRGGHILEVFEWGECGGEFFVALEYFPGRTLSEIIAAEGKLEPRRAARYAAAICRQLRFLHEFTPEGGSCRTPIVHGDIKPANVQVNAADELRLLDFGIAKPIRPGREMTRHELGSPSYCSPERLRDYRVDVHADLWGVGVTLFEMLAGALPFKAQNTRELEHRIQTDPSFEPPPGGPPVLVSILRRSLALRLEHRFPSAAAFEDELRRFLQPPAPRKRTILRRRVRTQARPQHGRSISYSTLAALLAGVLAGLLLFLPLAYHLRLEQISRTLAQTKDYSLLSAADLTSDWRLYQVIGKRGAWWRRLVSTESAEAAFRVNVLRSAHAAIERFRTGANNANWAQARLCSLYALQIEPEDRQTLADFHLASGFLAEQAKNTNTSYREFRRAAELEPRSPAPYLGLARLYAYRVHNAGATAAALHRAQLLGYQLGPRELEEQGDAYLYRAEQEFGYARRLPPESKAETLRLLRVAAGDFVRARNFYEPINGFSLSGANLERIDEEESARAKFETALLTPPSPKPHMVLLKVHFGGRAVRGTLRWR